MDKLEKEVRSLIDLCCKLPKMPARTRKALTVTEAQRYSKIIFEELEKTGGANE